MCWWLGPEVKKHDHEVPGTKVKNFYPVSKEVTLKVLKSNMTYLFFKWALAWEKKKNYQRQEGEVAVNINVSHGWKAERRSLPALMTIFSKSFQILLDPCQKDNATYFWFVVVPSLNHVLTLWWPHVLHHARLPCLSLSPKVCSNSCLWSQWCHPTISSSVTPFTCPQSFPASVFSHELALCIRWPNIGASASVSVLPMNIQGWFFLGLTGLCFSKTILLVMFQLYNLLPCNTCVCVFCC